VRWLERDSDEPSSFMVADYDTVPPTDSVVATPDALILAGPGHITRLPGPGYGSASGQRELHTLVTVCVCVCASCACARFSLGGPTVVFCLRCCLLFLLSLTGQTHPSAEILSIGLCNDFVVTLTKVCAHTPLLVAF
jgi:hypothetical protein